MTQLAYVPPFINQLNDLMPGDTYDENARMNCVAASTAWGNWSLTRKQYWAEEVKNAAYGEAYTGGTSADRYIAYEQSQGIKLWSYTSTNQVALVAAIHQFLRAGYPVLVTMPSQWGTPYSNPLQPSGTTHVGCAFSDDGGGIHVMNPWGGFDHYGSDSYWQPRLCFGAVWALALEGATPPLGIPTNWKYDSTAGVLTAPNGIQVNGPIAKLLMAQNWDATNVPREAAVALNQVELGNPALGPGTRQIFTYNAVGFTAARGAYLMWTGKELKAQVDEVDRLNAIITKMTVDAVALQNNYNALLQHYNDLQKDEQTDEATIANLKAQPQVNPTEHEIVTDLQAVAKLLEGNGATSPVAPASTSASASDPVTPVASSAE